VVSQKLEMQRAAGKFAFLLAGVYLLTILALVVSAATGEPIPPVGLPMMLVPAAAFGYSCRYAVRAASDQRPGGDREAVAAQPVLRRDRHRPASCRGDHRQQDHTGMTFQVDPAALRDFARRLDVVERVAEDARRYVDSNGSFTFHQQGIIGFAAPGHRGLISDLHGLLSHLRKLGAESQAALRQVADEYGSTDQRAAATVDASLPEVSRASDFRD
jgi:hypothetical protein